MHPAIRNCVFSKSCTAGDDADTVFAVAIAGCQLPVDCIVAIILHSVWNSVRTLTATLLLTMALTGTLAGALTLPTNLAAQESSASRQAALACDMAAAHPDDHLSKVAGVAWDDLDVEVAREACVEVFSIGPITGRVLYQSARLLDKDGDATAVAYLKQAIEEFEYPIAYYHLGLLYEDGLYVKKSSIEAGRMFREGFKRGSLVAGIALSRVLSEEANYNPYSQGAYLNTLKTLSERGYEPAGKTLIDLRASGYIAQYNEIFPHDKFE